MRGHGLAQRPGRARHLGWCATIGCWPATSRLPASCSPTRLHEAGVDVRLGADICEVRRGALATTDEGRMRGAPVTVVIDGEHVVADEVADRGRTHAAQRRPRPRRRGPRTPAAMSRPTTPCSSRASTASGSTPSATSRGRALLTHMGKYQARVCGDVIAARAKGEPVDAPALPQPPATTARCPR